MHQASKINSEMHYFLICFATMLPLKKQGRGYFMGLNIKPHVLQKL